MTTLTEPVHTAEFILSMDDDGSISVDTITIVSGQNLPAGQVLGKITASGKYKAYDNAAVDGSQTAAGILYAATDATGGDQPATGVMRLAEVTGSLLTGLDAPGTADLAALNIIVR